ncbi:hypothetical protein QWE_18403 [Agrobacterium albertimagni AOL15]|uniref:Uncharacterized protein n=2 Tax=Agrobacterium albertimagni TaxID=147266 RepID=K2Q4C9_9HYPH|nr:hypothetical protein QWE_18403 [Agrobacterium albertimagni AOL15]
MAGCIDPDAERAKREEFVALVTCGIQVMLQDAYSQPGLDTEGKARALSIYTLSLADALSAADRIPSDRSASSAALDVLDHVFGGIHSPETDPDRSWLVEIREGKRRKHRAYWAGYQPHSVVRKRVAQMRAPIKAPGDSKQPTPPDSPGLSQPTTPTPTERYHARTRAARVERIADLHKTPNARKILKAIHARGSMQLKDISPLVPKMKRLALRAVMMQLREGGWVESVGQGGGAAWTGTDQLKNSKI